MSRCSFSFRHFVSTHQEQVTQIEKAASFTDAALLVQAEECVIVILVAIPLVQSEECHWHHQTTYGCFRAQIMDCRHPHNQLPYFF